MTSAGSDHGPSFFRRVFFLRIVPAVLAALALVGLHFVSRAWLRDEPPRPGIPFEDSRDFLPIPGFAPDGKTFAGVKVFVSDAGGTWGGPIRLWDVSTGAVQVNSGEDWGPLHFVEYSPDGSLFAGAGSNGVIKIWDVAAWKEKATFSTKKGIGLTFISHFSPNGRWFVFADETREALHVWDTVAAKELLQLDSAAAPFAFSADSKLLAAVSGKSFRLWDLPSGKPGRIFPECRSEILALALTSDGQTVAYGTAGSGEEVPAEITLWDTSAESARATITELGWILKFKANDGVLLAPQPWDVTSMPPSPLHNPAGDVIAPDFRTYAKIVADGVELRDVGTATVKEFLPTRGYQFQHATRFSEDGKRIAITSQVSDWEINQGFMDRLLGNRAGFAPAGGAPPPTQETRIFAVSSGRLQAVCEGGHFGLFSSDGTMWAGISGDGTIKRYDPSPRPRTGLVVAACALASLLLASLGSLFLSSRPKASAAGSGVGDLRSA
jgi:WD40 repeat protein